MITSLAVILLPHYQDEIFFLHIHKKIQSIDDFFYHVVNLLLLVNKYNFLKIYVITKIL